MNAYANDETLLNDPAAKVLGIKGPTLRVWRHLGRGPRYIRLGEGRFSRVAYRRSDLEAWLRERTFTSTADETTRRAAGNAA